jgi:YebC/PmpR family DNA-binding regulatory protein
LGGGDVNSNPRLRTAVDKALAQNMTRDTIDRAINRGVGNQEGTQLDSVTYEGYGLGGVAVMVECLTDNRNRTASDVRHAFSKCGGNLGTDGSVAYLFSKVGQFIFAEGSDEDKIMEVALEAGALDITNEDTGELSVTCAPEDLGKLQDAFTAHHLKAISSEVTMLAATYVEADDEQAPMIIKMLEMLEELDDVQEVYSNVDISDEVAAKL